MQGIFFKTAHAIISESFTGLYILSAYFLLSLRRNLIVTFFQGLHYMRSECLCVSLFPVFLFIKFSETFAVLGGVRKRVKLCCIFSSSALRSVLAAGIPGQDGVRGDWGTWRRKLFWRGLPGSRSVSQQGHLSSGLSVQHLLWKLNSPRM